MLKTILAVVDGQNARHASLELAMRWAGEAQGMLVGLGIIDEDIVHPLEPVPLGGGAAKQELDAARLHQLQTAVENCLADLAVQCANRRIAFKPLESQGRPAEQIDVEAQRFDLIVMPRYLHDGSEPVAHGLTKALSTILRATPRPVIAVAERIDQGESVVIAFDGSLQAARTLQAFEATGWARNRAIHVVSVPDGSVEAVQCAQRAVEFLDYHGIRATPHIAKGGSKTAEQIIEHARRLDAGLLVMGAYGQPYVREFFLGSVTKSLLADCSIPLFLYH